jgi:hypothetical protein
MYSSFFSDIKNPAKAYTSLRLPVLIWEEPENNSSLNMVLRVQSIPTIGIDDLISEEYFDL